MSPQRHKCSIRALCIFAAPLLAVLSVNQYAVQVPSLRSLSTNACSLWNTYIPRLFHQNEWNSAAIPSVPNYEVQVFSHDPLILYIRDFLSEDEIQHLLKAR